MVYSRGGFRLRHLRLVTYQNLAKLQKIIQNRKGSGLNSDPYSNLTLLENYFLVIPCHTMKQDYSWNDEFQSKEHVPTILFLRQNRPFMAYSNVPNFNRLYQIIPKIEKVLVFIQI